MTRVLLLCLVLLYVALPCIFFTRTTSAAPSSCTDRLRDSQKQTEDAIKAFDRMKAANDMNVESIQEAFDVIHRDEAIIKRQAAIIKQYEAMFGASK